ncbi:hypothetical protein CWE09_08845 [Aliidiomarina minuta]|uniref:Cytochrome oxidase assembly protein n=1 Tax=Aliidiomarina minuta TaxID=880057 RepID=A0A432W9I5_9GAMM|nr:hypothetical protein [Aliidiomarina minuta]RUO26784.1 hypothetical protein CWE09_08845 [Aliidiomarina minuta]
MKATKELSPEQLVQRRKNRRLFIGIFLCFAIPLVGAKIILDMGWYNPGVTNKGELVDPPVELSQQDNEQLPDTWRLAFAMTENCDLVCENSLYVINQTHLALGRERSRVTPVAIQQQEEVSNLPELSPDSQMQYLTLTNAHQQLAEIEPSSMFIIDPNGFVVMYYVVSQDREQAIQQGRDMLDDLKKLLKMSRVG